MSRQFQPAAVILAAGASSRMGRSKPLLPIDGETFLDRLIARFHGLCDPICVVLGYNAAEIRADLRYADRVRFAINPAPERGMLSSLQCGLAEVADAEAMLFTPVDLPSVMRSTIEAIADAEAPVAVPRCDGRHGHPVRVSRAIAAELMALPPGAQARDVIHRHRDATLYIDVNDPGILHDVDTPADYEALIGAPGVRE